MLAGFFTDTVFTIVSALIWTAAYGGYAIASGQSPEEFQAVVDGPAFESFYSMVSLGLGTLGSVLGGYVCARIARRDDYRVVNILTGVSLLFAWIFLASKGDGVELIVATLLTIAAIRGGAMIWMHANRKPSVV